MYVAGLGGHLEVKLSVVDQHAEVGMVEEVDIGHT